METKIAYAGIRCDDKVPEFGIIDLPKGWSVLQIAPGSQDNEELGGRLTTYVVCLKIGW